MPQHFVHWYKMWCQVITEVTLMSCFEHSSAHHVQIKAVISTGTENIKFDQCASAIKPKLKW